MMLNFVAAAPGGLGGARAADGSRRTISAERGDAGGGGAAAPRRPLHWGVVLAALAAPARGRCSSEPRAAFVGARSATTRAPPRSRAFVPARELIAVMRVSGAFAGLAGAVELLGRDREALRAVLGRPGLHRDRRCTARRGCTPAASSRPRLFFGALAAGAGAMQRTADVSAVCPPSIQGRHDPGALGVETPRLARQSRRAAPPEGGPDARDHVVLLASALRSRRRSSSPRSASS